MPRANRYFLSGHVRHITPAEFQVLSLGFELKRQSARPRHVSYGGSSKQRSDSVCRCSTMSVLNYMVTSNQFLC